MSMDLFSTNNEPRSYLRTRSSAILSERQRLPNVSEQAFNWSIRLPSAGPRQTHIYCDVASWNNAFGYVTVDISRKKDSGRGPRGAELKSTVT
jgi:hypothetical protein